MNDANIAKSISLAHLEFTDQNNATKGERIGHRSTSSDFMCPAKALCRIAWRLHLVGAPPTCPLYQFFDRRTRTTRQVEPKHITNALRHAADRVKDITGIPPDAISARSLRPGGATALLCANVDSDAIQLLGRWKSDAMLRYLRIQANSNLPQFRPNHAHP